MTGKQIALVLLAALVIIKDPQLVTQILNGLLNLLNGTPNG
jgi:hypothetical protein